MCANNEENIDDCELQFTESHCREVAVVSCTEG